MRTTPANVHRPPGWLSTWAPLLVALVLRPGASEVQAHSPLALDDYIAEFFDGEGGLPGDSATAMVQDAEGFLWFGTFNGLARYDGVHFDVFHPDNTPGLPSPGIVTDNRGGIRRCRGPRIESSCQHFRRT